MYTKLIGLTETVAKDFFADIKKLFSLTPEQIKVLATHVDGKDGFSLPEKVISKLAEQFQRNPKDLVDALSVSRVIYKRLRQKEQQGGDEVITPDDLAKDLQGIAKEIDTPVTSAILDTLKVFFERKPNCEMEEAIMAFKVAIVPAIEGITFAYDVRAVFDQVDESKIVKFLPIVIIRISTIDDKDNKKTMVMQATEDTLLKLKRYIDASLKKMQTLQKELKSKGLDILKKAEK